MKVSTRKDRLLMVPFICLLISLIATGCSQTEGTSSSAERSLVASIGDEGAPDDIFDILEDYPGLEAFFTYGDLSRATFEDKMYRKVLGNTTYADSIVAMLDGLPPLFEARVVPEGIFSEDVFGEMNNKGPVPDLLSATAGLVSHVINLPLENKQPLYDYLDRLDIKENSSAEALETMNYIREILYRAICFQATLPGQTVNNSMDILAADLAEKQSSQDGKLDFLDLDDKIAEFALEAPEGLEGILQGSKKLFYDDEVKITLADLLYGLGTTLADENLFPVTREVLEGIYAQYDTDTLGELLDRLWTRGPIIGERLTKVGIPGYGQDGKQDHGLRQLLMHPQIAERFVEYITLFDEHGYPTDAERVAERVRDMIACDPHLQPRDGSGVFTSDSGFYQPTPEIDFRDYSYLRGLIKFGSRFHTGLSLTSPMLWENDDAESTLNLLRTLIPTVDRIAIPNLLWSPVFEKNPERFIGDGHPVTEKRGYGVMMHYDENLGGEAYAGFDGQVWVAPGTAGVASGAESAFLSIVDTIENGPYDNIWDNANYMLFERDIFLVMDLAQVAKRIALVGDFLSSPLGSLLGDLFGAISGSSADSIPLVLLKVDGINGLIHTELLDVIDGLDESLERGLEHAEVPTGIKNLILNLFSLPAVKNLVGELLISGMGKPETDAAGNTRYYMYPQDLRDTWPIILSSVGYFDPERFDPAAFQDRQNPEVYRWNYDTWRNGYRYAGHEDKASPMLPLIAALSLASKHLYDEAVEGTSLSLDDMEKRQDTARAQLGVTFPLSYVVNLLANLVEMPIETHSYIEGGVGVRMPLAETIEPLMAECELAEFLEAFLNFSSILGSERMQTARHEIIGGIAPLIGTIGPESTSPYTLAYEMLSLPRKALADPRYWDALEVNLDTGAALLSDGSPYQVTDTLVSLLDHLTDVDIDDEEWALVCEGLVQVLGESAEDRFLARVLIDTSDVLTHLNTTHCWADSLDLMQALLEPDGAVSYLLLGMERDPSFTWDAILSDTHRFLMSDTMQAYEEGSLWRDVYHLVKFMAEALQ